MDTQACVCISCPRMGRAAMLQQVGARLAALRLQGSDGLARAPPLHANMSHIQGV